MSAENNRQELSMAFGSDTDYSETPAAAAALQGSEWRFQLSDARLAHTVFSNCTTTLPMRTGPGNGETPT